MGKHFKTKIYAPHFRERSVGAVISIKDGVDQLINVDFQVQHVLHHPNGRYVGVTADHGEESFLILSVYTSPRERQINKREFIKKDVTDRPIQNPGRQEDLPGPKSIQSDLEGRFEVI